MITAERAKNRGELEKKLVAYEKVWPLGSVDYKDFVVYTVTPCPPLNPRPKHICVCDFTPSGHRKWDVNELYETLKGIFVW